MPRAFKFLGVLLVLSLGVGVRPAAATPITVVNMSPGWLLVPGADATYVLPAAGPETVGLFLFNQPWTGGSLWVHLSEPGNGGSISDGIVFDSLGPAGVGRVRFFSDTTLPDLTGYAECNNFPDGLTDPQTICPLCNNGGPLVVRFASSDQAGFRPFGVALT